MGTFAVCPFSLGYLVDFHKALVRRNLSVSERRTISFPPEGLLDLRNGETQDMKNKSRVQTCPNLGHFSGANVTIWYGDSTA
jgi:hypothetical protein